ncbi:MAG: hypothetical protein HFF48_09905, partial [Lawsonibacter sp.]|nr:hypothetical protein [Lawsonibacter sp.]
MNHLPSAVTLCEVGLRDGLQNEKTILPTEKKVELLRGLAGAGFRVIEVGSFMHPKAVPQMADSSPPHCSTVTMWDWAPTSVLHCSMRSTCLLAEV